MLNEKQFKKVFSENLKDLRESRQMTQADLAKRVGLTADWISHMEHGRRFPSAFINYKLNYVLGRIV